jgi:tetratricopeptide (TPR) repeat protein
MPLARRVCGALLLVATLAVGAYSQTIDDSELNLGIKAFKAARIDEAIQHFRNAIAANPQDKKAHMYLATAYAQDYIPGSMDPDNLQKGQQAIAQYKAVLELEPANGDATKAIGFLYLQMKQFEEAKTFYSHASEIDPKDPDPYYSIAVIDWATTYAPRMKMRAKLGLPQGKPLINSPECSEVRSANEQLVTDGIDKLNKALQLRPDYDDAMAYMNLMYRELADIQCGDSRAYAADLAKANKWVDLMMAVRKAKSEGRSPQKPSGDATNQQPQ